MPRKNDSKEKQSEKSKRTHANIKLMEVYTMHQTMKDNSSSSETQFYTSLCSFKYTSMPLVMTVVSIPKNVEVFLTHKQTTKNKQKCLDLL